MSLQSYKPYSRLVTIIAGIIITIASLDASQVIHIFPNYANQINTILFIAGLVAPAISQELRVVRAEELVVEDMNNQTGEDELQMEDFSDELGDDFSDTASEGDIHFHINLDGDEILSGDEIMSEEEEFNTETEGGGV